jgi:hypothetical protein
VIDLYSDLPHVSYDNVNDVLHVHVPLLLESGVQRHELEYEMRDLSRLEYRVLGGSGCQLGKV